ncbi:hypothetical protein FGB62_2g016 [Gracilaria domingensis]|nr:hypothetical protein FGB62_2g016 [Gracilaria domingensis]
MSVSQALTISGGGGTACSAACAASGTAGACFAAGGGMNGVEVGASSGLGAAGAAAAAAAAAAAVAAAAARGGGAPCLASMSRREKGGRRRSAARNKTTKKRAQLRGARKEALLYTGRALHADVEARARAGNDAAQRQPRAAAHVAHHLAAHRHAQRPPRGVLVAAAARVLRQHLVAALQRGVRLVHHRLHAAVRVAPARAAVVVAQQPPRHAGGLEEHLLAVRLRHKHVQVVARVPLQVDADVCQLDAERHAFRAPAPGAFERVVPLQHAHHGARVVQPPALIQVGVRRERQRRAAEAQRRQNRLEQPRVQPELIGAPELPAALQSQRGVSHASHGAVHALWPRAAHGRRGRHAGGADVSHSGAAAEPQAARVFARPTSAKGERKHGKQ